jgi:flavorubredoxin
MEEIKPGIYWVGGIDWDVRNFHGYLTQRGATYNAYLIMDEKIVLVDTVKHYLFDEMVARIREVVDPSKIDYIVSNHVEMDHSGSLPKMLQLAPDAKVVTSPNGEKGLRRHYKEDWDFFGQHIATPERFDEEVGWDVLHEEAAKYYANIVFPYGDQVKKALDALFGLDVEIIAPGHGIIWRTYIPKILEAYQRWATNKVENRAVIVYDTMWGSTEKMAYSLRAGLEKAGIPVTMRNLKTLHISDIMADVLRSKAIMVGSPTLNNGIFPPVGAFLTYLKGLRPKNRIGFAFGSYGWGGQAVKEVETTMNDLGWDMPVEGLKIQYIPDEEELNGVKEIGKKLGEVIKKWQKQ